MILFKMRGFMRGYISHAERYLQINLQAYTNSKMLKHSGVLMKIQSKNFGESLGIGKLL